MTDSPAEALWQARDNDTRLAADFDGAPLTEDEGYDVQAAMIAASGLPVVGWKIGATVAAMFDVLGVSQPFLGPLFERFTFESGDTVPILPGHSLETEITVRMKTDLPHRTEPYSRAEAEAAIGALHPSFEVVGVRFEGELAGAGPKLIADGGANVASVLGPAITDWQGMELADYPIPLSLKGTHAVDGNTTVLYWDHIFDAVSWTANHPAMVGRGLKAGDILMTGTTTGMTPLAAGDEAVAQFAGMGEVRATFT